MSRQTSRLLAASVLVLALVWQHVQATKLGYEAEACRRDVRALRARIADAQLELERSSSPTQLVHFARTRLGMLPARPETVRQLTPLDRG